MKILLLFLLFAAGLFAADTCASSHVNNVTLTTCRTGEGQLHLFISTSDVQTIAFYVAVRTDTGGLYLTVENYKDGAVHASPKIKGKLQHITVTELRESNNAAFSIDNGTLP